MTEKRLKELTARLSQRSPHSAGLQPHEPPNRRRFYERPRTECYAADPCLPLAESNATFTGTHVGATTDFFSGTHLGVTTDFFSGTHLGAGGADAFGGTHMGSNTAGEYGGTHASIAFTDVWE